jgi:POLO box duplicated region
MDHTKLIISHNGLLLTYLDKNYQCSQHLTVDLLDPSVQEGEHQLQRSKDKLISKVKYARDVLKLIRSGEVPTFNGVPAGKATVEGEAEAVATNMAGATNEEGAPAPSKPRTRSSTTFGATSTVRGTRANPR